MLGNRSKAVSAAAFIAFSICWLTDAAVRADTQLFLPVAGMPASVVAPLHPIPVVSRRPAPTEPANEAARRVLALLDRVEAALRISRYSHVTRVREREGRFEWDCSGMTQWILERSAPRAAQALRKQRPVARDYERVIAAAPRGTMRRAWQRVSVQDAKSGDVFAWERPRDWGPGATGHVGFLLEEPQPVPGHPGGWTVRIADSTSRFHEEDSRTHRWLDGGYGEGTLYFHADSDGEVSHYGWYGSRSEFLVRTHVVFGRVSR